MKLLSLEAQFLGIENVPKNHVHGQSQQLTFYITYRMSKLARRNREWPSNANVVSYRKPREKQYTEPKEYEEIVDIPTNGWKCSCSWKQPDW